MAFNKESVVLYPTIATLPVTGLTASANSDVIEVGGFLEAIVFINMTAQSGTTPTLDCKIQYSPDKKNWVDSGDSFTQMTTVTGLFFKKLSSNFGKYARLVFTLAGTSPNYTFVPTVVVKF